LLKVHFLKHLFNTQSVFLTI